MPIVHPRKLYVAVYSDNMQELLPRSPEKNNISDNIKGKFSENASGKKLLTIAEEDLKGAITSSFGKDEIFARKRLELHKPTYFAFICNSEKAMQMARQTTIYSVPVRDFMPFNSEQWVLDKGLKLADCKAVYRIETATDIMAGGVQVFSVTDKLKAVVNNGLLDFVEQKKDEKDFLPILGELVSRGLLQWENYNTNIKVDKIVAREMGFKIYKRDFKIDFKPLL